MVSAKNPNFLKDESGAAYLEFTAAAFTFFIILFGVVEFANVFYQWNAATKATQWGARLAAVSNPVAYNLNSLTGTEAGALPGVAMPNFDCTCQYTGNTLGCTGTVPNSAPICDIGTGGLAAMKTLVYGRGNTTNTCINTGANIGMCNLFSRLTLQNVVVRYQNTGLGYAGRPVGKPPAGVNNWPTGAPVPTITVSLHQRKNPTDSNVLQYEFILIGALMRVVNAAFPTAIDLPGFATTVTGEDLNGAGG